MVGAGQHRLGSRRGGGGTIRSSSVATRTASASRDFIACLRTRTTRGMPAMGWRGFPGKRCAPIREGITTTARSGWRTSNGNPCPRTAGYHPRVSGSPTWFSLAPLLATGRGKAAAALVSLALSGAVAQGAWRSLTDPLRPALWIGHPRSGGESPAGGSRLRGGIHDARPAPHARPRGGGGPRVGGRARREDRGEGCRSGTAPVRARGPATGRDPHPDCLRQAREGSRVDPAAPSGRLRKGDRRRHRPGLGGRRRRLEDPGPGAKREPATGRWSGGGRRSLPGRPPRSRDR